jgi:hypothetical protein
MDILSPRSLGNPLLRLVNLGRVLVVDRLQNSSQRQGMYYVSGSFTWDQKLMDPLVDILVVVGDNQEIQAD